MEEVRRPEEQRPAQGPEGPRPSPVRGVQVGDTDEGQVLDISQLWRIEGSVTGVRSEVDQLKTLDDEHVRARLVALERGWRAELDAILPPTLASELDRILDESDARASAAELRLELAQLEGWLDGLISGMGFVVLQAPAA